MCGRYTQISRQGNIEKRFKTKPLRGVSLHPQYNIAPSQPAPVILLEKERTLTLKRWGLKPGWMGRSGDTPLINARAETLEEKPAYRDAFKKRRCLIPANGFYEWRSAKRAPKRPVYFTRCDLEPFAFAGLWENETFSIITTEANGLVKGIHPRMPVILSEKDEDLWLDPSTKGPSLKKVLTPFSARLMKALEVSERVNATENDDPGLIEPYIDPQPELDII